jgi:hypothetical protein
MEQEIVKKTSCVAVASLLCVLAAVGSGLLFVLFGGWFVEGVILVPYVATVLAIVAIVWITIRRKVLKGYIYAILTIILCLPFLYIHWGVKQSVKVRQQRKKEWIGLYNLELLGKEMVKYAEDNDGHLPAADRWCDELMEHNKNLTKDNFRHPLHKDVDKKDFKLPPLPFSEAFQSIGDCQYAFNKNLSGKRLADIPGNVVLIFEADGDWNMAGGPELLMTRSNWDYITMLFADQTTANYWFYKDAVRVFNKKGTQMYYVEPRWKP